jgi:hypothetical protein
LFARGFDGRDWIPAFAGMTRFGFPPYAEHPRELKLAARVAWANLFARGFDGRDWIPFFAGMTRRAIASGFRLPPE